MRSFSTFAVLLLVTFASTAVHAAAVDPAGLLGGRLTPHWGYELVGADFVTGEILEKRIALKTVRMATPDDPDSTLLVPSRFPPESSQVPLQYRNKHATYVASVVAGERGYAPSAQYVFVDSKTWPPLSHVDLNEMRERKVQLYSGSTAAGEQDFFAELNLAGITSVRSAGNSFPEKSPQAGAEHSIIVGQISPLGGARIDSQRSPSVVFAPGRNYVYVDRRWKQFGGTSAAQPLVAACVANAIALLLDLKPAEVRQLIQISAIPNRFLGGEESATGSVLNCYRLFRIAYRLQKKWPQSRSRLMASDPLLSDFKSEAKSLLSAGEYDITNLRKAFLLDPLNMQTAEKLAKAYRTKGLVGNAWFYETLTGESAKHLQRWLAEIRGTEFEFDLLRLPMGNTPAFHAYALNEARSAAAFFSLYRHSNMTATQLQATMLKLFANRTIDSNYEGLFSKLYFSEQRFPKAPILKICAETMPTIDPASGITSYCELIARSAY